jgi:DNA ligase-1
VGKNIGRSNETTPLQQAQLEAKSLWKKQVETGYVDDPKKLDAVVLLPMLANKWEDKSKYIREPFFVQPKLDGVRMLVGKRDGKFIMISRTGKPVKMPHIEAELAPLLNEGDFVDGENYTTERSFEQITGMCRTQDGHSDIEVIKFHIFDFYNLKHQNETFNSRLAKMQKFKGLKHCVLVETVWLSSKDKVQAKHDEYAAQGYEGIMIRDAHGIYKLAERSNTLLKFKAFQTEEYTIVGAEEGKGRDAGTVVWICSSKAGNFSVRPKGTFEERTEWFRNKNKYVGKPLTVQFQNLTNGGIPRFPVGLAIRDYE